MMMMISDAVAMFYSAAAAAGERWRQATQPAAQRQRRQRLSRSSRKSSSATLRSRRCQARGKRLPSRPRPQRSSNATSVSVSPRLRQRRSQVAARRSATRQRGWDRAPQGCTPRHSQRRASVRSVRTHTENTEGFTHCFRFTDHHRRFQNISSTANLPICAKFVSHMICAVYHHYYIYYLLY